MFLPRDAFDDEEESSHSTPNAGNSSSAATDSSSLNQSQSQLTPAMRKAKMDELRQQAKLKQKSKNLAQTQMIRQAEVPKSSMQTSLGSLPISPSHGPVSVSVTAAGAGSAASHFSLSQSPNPSHSQPQQSHQPQQSRQPTHRRNSVEENNSNNANATENNYSNNQNNGSGSNANTNSNQRNSSANNNNNGTSSSSSSGVTGRSDVSDSVSPPNPVFHRSGHGFESPVVDINFAMRDRSDPVKELAAQGISPVFDPVKKVISVSGFDFSNLNLFVASPPPRNQIVHCYIARNKKGWNKMYPQYELYLEDGDRFLMAAKKRSGNKTSNYLMTTDIKNFDKDSDSFVGKVRSNFVGTEFVSYDAGINPKEEKAKELQGKEIRKEIAAMFYESNILGSKGPRRMTALIPAVNRNGIPIVWQPKSDAESIVGKYKAAKSALEQSGNGASTPSSTDEFIVLSNKTPKWNEQVGAYVLNFNGRVTMASVKNFQLISSEDSETVLLQFGRVAKDSFTMDYQWPMTAAQAFGICLSSFDHKLACE